MKKTVKYTIERMVQLALQLFWLVPLRDRVCFSSFSGRQYSDSPRRISELLAQQRPDIAQVWAFNEPEKFAFLRARNITVVKYKSLRYIWYVMTSRVYVDNVEFWSALKFRPGQLVLETWHGGGAYKRVGADRLDIDGAEQRHAVEKMNKITLFLSSCRAFTDYVIRGAYEYSGEVLECGLPRNDELLQPSAQQADAVRAALQIPAGHKVLLYAPTFRNSHSLDLYDVDFATLRQALQQRFGGEWTIVLRMHYYLMDKVLEAGKLDFVVDATQYGDMQELLLATDVLLTDYSSSMWDFSLMGRPCFLYAPDLAAYQNERNFYTPLDSWPFPAAQDNAQLARAVRQFDADAYAAAVAQHHAQLGACESGHATQLSCQRIISHLGGNP